VIFDTELFVGAGFRGESGDGRGEEEGGEGCGKGREHAGRRRRTSPFEVRDGTERCGEANPARLLRGAVLSRGHVVSMSGVG